MENTNRCSVAGCELHAIAVLDLRHFCLAHFLTACYERLEELNQNSRNWLFGGAGLESVHRSLEECAQQATRIAQEERELTNMERAQLVDVLLWANDLSKQIRRSPRDATSIPIRLISEMPGRCWQEETHTFDLSRHGAQTNCHHAAKNGDVLKLLRLDTGEQVEARVVWLRQKASGAQEIGLEVMGHENFWGLDVESPR